MENLNIWIQLAIIIFVSLVFIYVPMQFYARKIEDKISWNFSKKYTRMASISVAYFVFYPSILYLLVGAWLNENFGIRFNMLFCGASLLWMTLAILVIESRKTQKQ